MKLTAIPGHVRTLRNGHQLVATVRRVGLRQGQARAFGKAFQVVRSPREYSLRRRLAKRLLSEVTPPVSVGDGFVRFHAKDLPYGSEALAVCEEIVDAEKAAYPVDAQGKGFLRTLLNADSLRTHHELLSVATSREILATVTEYLGEIPILADVRLWWSVPDKSATSPMHSQKFHRDHEDFRQLKVFLNVDTVTADSGPFTFLPASLSEKIAGRVSSPDGRYDDEQILRLAAPEEPIALTGEAGDVAMVDTARCFHYGSRNEKQERLLLMLHYVSYNSIFEPDVKVLTKKIRDEWQRRDPTTAALMRIRPYGL